ncbi:MAG TPA: COX15/CtaA family protein [Planctomycetota bacterium]|nr:COX15/CtaA family protein [Planctomycetota bacterium]
MRALSLSAVVLTLVMIALGALVTSRDAGLSIPDWPLAFDEAVPEKQLAADHVVVRGREYSRGDVASEWVHRVTGATLGALVVAVVVAAHVARTEPRVRRLAWAALALVVVQGIVGGVGVLRLQPAVLAVTHALLAQSLLAVLVALSWLASARRAEPPAALADGRRLRAVFVSIPALLLAQLFLGATFRHANVAAALILHVAVALGLLAVVAWAALRVQDHGSRASRLVRPTIVLGALLLAQIFLGALAYLFRQPKTAAVERGLATNLFPTAHVVLGAAILAHAVALAMRAARTIDPEPAVAARASSA